MAMRDLVGKFCLENILTGQTDVGLEGRHPDLVVKMGMPVVLAEFDGSEFDIKAFVIRLVRFHGTHRAKPRIAATL